MSESSILILENKLQDFNILVEALCKGGYNKSNFLHCKNIGEVAGCAITNSSFEVILADVDTGDSPSPADNLRYIQQLFPATPIIVLTDAKDDEQAIKYIQAGAQSFVVKGLFTSSNIIQIIRNSKERYRITQELEKLKEDYQNLFDTNPLPIFVLDKNTSKFTTVNKAAVAVYGYSKEDFSSLSFDDVSRNLVESNELQTERFEGSYIRHYKKNGECLLVELTKRDITHKSVASILITVNDVTEKVLAAEEKQKAKHRLDAVFNGTHDAILLTDERGRYLQVNPAACSMLGYTEEELLSLSVEHVVHKLVSETNNENLWDKFLNTGSQRGVIELKRKDGKIILCSYNASANVLPGLHLSILTDITEGEIARRKIEEQGRRIENILETISDCFYAVDCNWIVKYWNKAAEELLGVKREDVVGRCIWDVYPDAVDLPMYARFHIALEQQVAIHLEDYYPPLGLWADISAYPTPDGLTIVFKDITARKKQSFEILEAKNKKAALINASTDLIWSIDSNLKLVSYNTAFAKRMEDSLGLQVAEGFQLPSSIHKGPRFEAWKTYYKRALKGEAFTVEDSIQDPKTGEIKRAEINFNPFYKVNSKVIKGVACYSHDITERVKYQSLIEEQNERLKASEQHLKKITAQLEKVMNSSLDVICSIDAEGRFVQVSKASAHVWGYEPEELIGNQYMDYVHPEYKNMTETVAEEITSGIVFTNFQNVYVHKNGTAVPLIWSARWDRDEQIMFCVARDATALKEAEKMKTVAEQRFSALIQKGADMVGIIDSYGNYLYASPNIESILGYKPEYLHQKNALQLIHPDDVPMARGELQKVVVGGEVKLAAFRYKHASGEWRWFETIATNQLTNPAIKGIVINSRDITNRKQIETEREMIIKELLKSNADLKQFSFITSHNLRAPLSNVRGILNIVDYESLNDYNRQMIEMLEVSAKQLQKTIDDLSNILVIKNNVNIEVSSIDLNEAIVEVKNTFINALNDVCADIITDFKIKEIEFNKTYLQSILVNLVSNSIKYRSRKRNLLIEITTSVDEDGNIVFRFSDNGSGIDLSRHKNKLFGLYQRFHSNGEGQGLGLFIIKSQIVALGGRIDVESEPDQGTSFIITFRNPSSIFTGEENKDKSTKVMPVQSSFSL